MPVTGSEKKSDIFQRISRNGFSSGRMPSCVARILAMARPRNRARVTQRNSGLRSPSFSAGSRRSNLRAVGSPVGHLLYTQASVRSIRTRRIFSGCLAAKPLPSKLPPTKENRSSRSRSPVSPNATKPACLQVSRRFCLLASECVRVPFSPCKRDALTLSQLPHRKQRD